MLIGSKEIFGIEFEITRISKKKTLYGKAVLWLDNKYIGCYDESRMINVFNNTLLAKWLSDRNISDTLSLLELIKSKKLEVLQEKECGSYVLEMGESFHDFKIAIVHNTDKVVFWWKLERKNSEKYTDYPEEVQIGVIDKNIFNTVVEEYLTEIDNMIGAFKLKRQQYQQGKQMKVINKNE